jgi:hypothetical protein
MPRVLLAPDKLNSPTADWAPFSWLIGVVVAEEGRLA